MEPHPRPIPLDSPCLSPATRRTYTYPKTGVLNSGYHPSTWQTNDGRPLIPLRVPGDLPPSTGTRPFMPQPQPSPGEFYEQLNHLINEYRDALEPSNQVPQGVKEQTDDPTPEGFETQKPLVAQAQVNYEQQDELVVETGTTPAPLTPPDPEPSRKPKYGTQNARAADLERPRKRRKVQGRRRGNSDNVLTPFSVPAPGGRTHWQSKRRFSSDGTRPGTTLKFKNSTNQASNIAQLNDKVPAEAETETEPPAPGPISTTTIGPTAPAPALSQPKITINLNLKSIPKPRSTVRNQPSQAAKTKAQAQARKPRNPTTLRTHAVTRSQIHAHQMERALAGPMTRSRARPLMQGTQR